MALARISIVPLPVCEQASAKRYHVNRPGFTVLHDGPPGRDRRRTQLEAAGGGPIVSPGTRFGAMPTGCPRGREISANDVDDTYETLKGRGVGVSDVQSAPWGHHFTFEDPDNDGRVVQGAAAPAG